MLSTARRPIRAHNFTTRQKTYTQSMYLTALTWSSFCNNIYGSPPSPSPFPSPFLPRFPRPLHPPTLHLLEQKSYSSHQHQTTLLRISDTKLDSKDFSGSARGRKLLEICCSRLRCSQHLSQRKSTPSADVGCCRLEAWFGDWCV